GSWLPGELRGTNIVVLIVVIAAHHSRSPPQSYARLPKLHRHSSPVARAFQPVFPGRPLAPANHPNVL
ncbi:MAG: hypothetical protein NTX09_02430, partial [Verrucomicrobia bacterium]|nr:hypothetical protein [Verrucomicrobiota bacterium]